MKLLAEESFSHYSSVPHLGVLLVNVGSPVDTHTKSVRIYLRQFLRDPRIVELPRFFWFFILELFILPFRSAKSAKKYAKIWRKEGSPLLFFSKSLVDKLISRKKNQSIQYALGMLNGQPSISSAIEKLAKGSCHNLFVLPMFPQYSSSTVGSVFTSVSQELQKRRWIPELRFLNQYHDHSLYIEALAKSIEEHWKKIGKKRFLLFSYHGLPLFNLWEGDPYHCQCHKTTRLVAERLSLDEANYQTSFQSRFGRQEWLKPYTSTSLEDLVQKGVSEIDILAPAFSIDCLETLEEIVLENKDIFLGAGGKEYSYIPCLNDTESHLLLYEKLIEENTQAWIKPSEKLGNRAELYQKSKWNKKPTSELDTNLEGS